MKKLIFLLLLLLLTTPALAQVPVQGLPVVTSATANDYMLIDHYISAGVFTTSRISLANLTGALGTDVDVLYGYGSGTSYTDTAIQAAMTALGGTNKHTLLLRPGTWVISGNLTITSNFTLKAPPGTTLQINTGMTLTINGPLYAGRYQIFNCVGSGSVAGLKYTRPEWFGAKGDGSTDDSIALQSTSASVASGGIIEFQSGTTYKIYTSGLGITGLGAWSGVNGIIIKGNGATLAQDTSTTYASSNGTMFAFTQCTDVSVEDFKVTGNTAWYDFTSVVKGNEFVRVTGGTNIHLKNIYVQGAQSALILARTVAQAAAGTYPVTNVTVDNLYFQDGWYGVAGEFQPYGMTINNLQTNNIHRSLFIYGAKNVKAQIYSKNPYAKDVLIKSYSGYGCENIDVTYYSGTDTQASSDSSEKVAIEFGDATAARFSNIKLNLDIAFNNTGQTGAGAVRITKYNNVGGYDASDEGHTLENLTISGKIDGNSHYSEPVIMMDTLCTWGTGDYFKNISLKDLVITNNIGTVVFSPKPFVNGLKIDDVLSSTYIIFDYVNYPCSTKPIITNSTFPNQWVKVGSDLPLSMFYYAASYDITGATLPSIISNRGATGGIIVTLPVSIAGMEYAIVRETDQDIDVDPNGSEVIHGGGAGKKLYLHTTGNAVTIKCFQAGIWEITAVNGAISFES